MRDPALARPSTALATETTVPDADLRIKLPIFEGPLDLLLFLIRKNELDIYDIPIAVVTRQYIQVLRSMRELDLEIAGEFFVMAASLMEIKSRMLLPRGQAAVGENVEDDPLDPRWELVHQLLQYKKFKEAAAKLDELAAFQRDLLARHVSALAVLSENDRPLKPVDRIELWNAFNIVLRRLAEKLVVGEIKGEEVTVSDKMEELLDYVKTRKTFLFTDLFEGKQVTVRLLVATFIAVLELTRLKKLRVRQDEAYGDIHVDVVEDYLAPVIAEDPRIVAARAAAIAAEPADLVLESPAASDTTDAAGYAIIPSVVSAVAPRQPLDPDDADAAGATEGETNATLEPAPAAEVAITTAADDAPPESSISAENPASIAAAPADLEPPADAPPSEPPAPEPATAETLAAPLSAPDEKPLETPAEGRTLTP